MGTGGATGALPRMKEFGYVRALYNHCRPG